jgi:tetratricopeptide (TPR) repeat protein
MKYFSCLILITFSLQPVSAGIYGIDDPCYFDIGADGKAVALSYEQFRVALDGYWSKDFRSLGEQTADRKQLESRIEKMRAIPVESMTPEQLASYSADLIRFSREGLSEGLNKLQPLVRDRRRAGFVLLSHLSHLHQARGEMTEAYEKLYSAIKDYGVPKQLPGSTVEQTAWLKRVESQFHLPWLLSRMKQKLQPGQIPSDVDPIFRIDPSNRDSEALRFETETQNYQAGSIPEIEKNALPSDAVAIVQQLIFWYPQDARLYWLLGELYNATGQPETAVTIFDQCVDAPRNLTSPSLLRHRAELHKVLDEARAEKKQTLEKAQAVEKNRWLRAWIIGGILGGILLVAQVWLWIRKLFGK